MQECPKCLFQNEFEQEEEKMSAKENGSRFKRPVISIRMLPMGKQLQKLPPQVDLQVVSSTKIDDLDFSIHREKI